MVNFREKWLKTLFLAILLHVIFFSILYIMLNKKTIDNSIDNNSNKFTTPVVLDKKYPPLKTQTDIITPTSVVESTVADARSPDKALLPQKADQPKTTNDIAAEYVKTGQLNNSDKTLKIADDKIIENNEIVEITPNVSENTESSSMAINNAGLLGRDTPAQNTFGKTNKEYDAAKSDLEQTNNQLSDAINEVKKRNQQKIDELDQQSPYPVESDNIFN